ncbi:DUF2157 domain-containing protein [Aquamicrobium segne]|uniref:DUF2157 domain-containing protein n=1 Tax=Aquamicrobium segne TaxID=469547 RepID=A0ABW0GWE7_9HYPH
MTRYIKQLRHDAERWVASGLIDPETAKNLVLDAQKNERRSFGSSTVLAMMAALLFSAGILIFIAANWESFPRLARVGGLFALIIGGYVGGAFARLNHHNAAAEALWIIAAAAFGASLALIGQMYHISGDEAAALLTWCAATALAALVLRSGPLTAACVGISIAWLSGAVTGGWIGAASYGPPILFVPIVAVLWGISYWTGAKMARHLILLSLIGYVAWCALDGDVFITSALMASVCAGIFVMACFMPQAVEAIARLDGRTPLHALIGFWVAMMLIQFDLEKESGFPVAVAITLAGIVGALIMAGHTSRGLRWIAYLAFATELCLIYALTMGTMLGTAGFFVFAAVLMGLLAMLIIRLERRAKDAAQSGAQGDGA